MRAPSSLPAHGAAARLAAVAAVAAFAAVVLAAGCSGSVDPIRRPAPVTGSADFSNYVAIGTSVTMGIQSAGLRGDHQLNSFPALIAGATDANGGNFVQPLVGAPGIPPLLRLVGFTVEGQPIIEPTPGTPPAAPSVPRPADGYDNLGISGTVLANALAKTTGDDPTNYFDLVLQGQGTMVRQAVAQRPTFVTVELGVNDIVRTLVRGSDAFLIPPGEFAALYTQILDSLVAAPSAPRLALMNIPNVIDVPYSTAIPLDVVFPLFPGVDIIRLRDAAGPLPDGTRILLPAGGLIAGGYGFPDPAPPLPDSLVITLAERATIEAAVRDYNAVIAAQATARQAALADANGLFARLHTHGILIGGVRYTSAYVSGGLFSLDGLHPSSLGHGLIANEFIRAINQRFGADIAPVDLRRIQFDVGPIVTPAARRGAEPWRAIDPVALAATRQALLAE
jgi:lysophospholipase L1-like esterase